MEKRSKSLIKNTTILGFGTLCTKGIMFFMTPLFTRWLTREEFGTFDLLVTYITLLVPLLTIASGEAIFRLILDETNKKKEKDILSTAFWIDIVGIVISLIISVIIFFITDINKNIIVSFLFYLINEILYNYFMMAMRGKKRLNIYTVANILFVVFMAVFVFIFVYIFKMGLCGILLGYGCGDLVSIIVICWRSKIYKEINIFNFSNKTFKDIIQYSIPMIPNSISWWIVNVSDRTLISLVYGTECNAIYAVANKVPALCNTFFSVFHLSWQQNATEALSDEDRDKYYTNVFNNMICIVISICIFILGFNYWFFKLFTEEYAKGYYQSPILIMSIIFSMMGQFIGGIYVAQKKSKKNGITTIIAASINIIVNILLINKIGLYAASMSTLIAYLTLFIIRYIDIKKDINIKISQKSQILFGITSYFLITSYINLGTFKYINVFLSSLVFIVINFDYLRKIFFKK